MDLNLELRKTLNNEQYEAATFVNGPAVIMAGAGSGKTHTLINRVANLVNIGVAPERILMLTFTNAAADEMKNRAASLLDKRCDRIIACTYHKFCNMMLRQYGNGIGIREYSILSYPETKNMVDYVKSSDAMFDNLKGFPSAGTVAEIMSMSVNKQTTIQQIVTKIEKYEKYRDYETEIQVLANNVAVYGWRNQKFTYDDLLIYMNRLLDDPNVCQHIAKRYQYIMVDEFQDTNNLQESIILKLAKYNNNIVVVGDISQSIYAFRGANVKNLQNFHTKLANCKNIVLNSNYRSTQEVLDAANKVMNANVRSWKYYDMLAVDKNGPTPVLFNTIDNNTEAKDVIELITGFHQSGIPFSEIAILERSSMASFEIENMLTQLDINFTKMGGMKFMDYDCIGDMLAYFSVIVNPHDLLSWFRVLQLHPDIGKGFAKKIADGCNTLDFLSENEFKNRKFYKELLLLQQQYNKWRGHDNLLSLFDDVSKFYFDVRKRCVVSSRMTDDNKQEALMEIEAAKSVVHQLRNMSKKYDSVVAFVDDIMLDSVTNDEDDVNQLTISTIHSAKGLEWTVVIILDCVEGAFPAKITVDKYGSEEDEEELRCLYVAMTRAKQYLTLMVPKCRMTYAGYDTCEMSHYLLRCQNSFVTKSL